MAEIKVEEGINKEISALRNAGAAISSTSSTLDDASKLPTCSAYRERCNALQEIVTQFGELIKKDAQEIEAFVANMRKLDSN